MRLTRLIVRDVRSVEAVDWRPVAGVNVLVGPNGGGKTSMLEAIHLAVAGRSFRTRDTAQVIRRGASGLRVGAWFELDDGRRAHIRMERDAAGTRLRRDGEVVRSASQLARAFPVLVLSQDGVRRFRTERAERRGVMDWGVFHVKPEFHAVWSRYHAALAQRNAALRRGQPVEPWLGPLAEAGGAMSAYREGYLSRLQEHVTAVESEFGFSGPLKIELQRGWREGVELDAYWRQSESRDRRLGYTGGGPHRANLSLGYGNGIGLEQCSSGQVKIAYLTFRLAQLRELLAARPDVEPMVFFDDLTAELDGDHLAGILGGLVRQPLQRFVTSPVLTADLNEHADAVFHVKHGAITTATN
ncbi:MAG TPA: DNA replication and repair protein RecF [Gammaproteobacteria bacterium]|uniref:DNA replication/repair protein RecF n=1 Tax=Immundisolibacter sp. TaxID=1934948 RepID=UPI000E8195B9|nr:DNA replication and repair protein RecF [Gammaproteobacteria bacterium]MCH77874.1 DNA replication and repair protein RecF [Gammaproteobacteria bacterium]